MKFRTMALIFFSAIKLGYTADGWQKIDNYQGKGFYVFQNGFHTYFTPPVSFDRLKVFLLTIPKSGTYLYEAIFNEMGYAPSHIHLFEKGFQDLRKAEGAEDFAPSADKTFRLPASEILALIGPGQVTPGHISYSLEREQALIPFKVILTKRNLRDCLVSFMRFIEKHKLALNHEWLGEKDKNTKIKGFLKLDAPHFAKMVLNMAPWFERPQAFQLSYETLMGDKGEAACLQMQNNLAKFLDIPFCEVEKAVARARKQSTMTSSGRRSHYQEYWNNELEAFFEESGLKAMNQRLGYN